jgi:hypothetical protein
LLNIATKLRADYGMIAGKTTQGDAGRMSALRTFITFIRPDIKNDFSSRLTHHLPSTTARGERLVS